METKGVANPKANEPCDTNSADLKGFISDFEFNHLCTLEGNVVLEKECLYLIIHRIKLYKSGLEIFETLYPDEVVKLNLSQWKFSEHQKFTYLKN